MTSQNGSRHKQIRVVVSDELLTGFEALAAARRQSGAALVRDLIAQALNAPGLAVIAPHEPRRSAAMELRLTEQEFGALDQECLAMGLSRTAWVSAMVRRRVSRKPTLDVAEQYCLVAMQADLRRTAANVNQIARRADAAAAAGAVFDPDARFLHELRAEIRAHMAALRSAIEGNLAYWDVGT